MLSLADRPVIVLGNNRSGTSLLRLMLTHHPDLVIPPESHFFLWLYDRFKGWSPQDGTAHFLAALFECTKIETWSLDRDGLARELTREAPSDYSELIACVYLYYGKSLGRSANRWGDKNSLWVEKLPAIAECYPRATIIHIVRDGRDVACSYREVAAKKLDSRYAPRLPTDLATIAELWSRNVSAVRRFGRDGVACYAECRYEDLIREPESVLRGLAEPIGVEYHPAMLSYLEDEHHSQVEPTEFLAWKASLLEPLDATKSGRFKSDLTAAEIAEFEERGRSSLMEFGYEPLVSV